MFEELKLPAEDMLHFFDSTYGIARFAAGVVRGTEPALGVARDPREGRLWHGLVFATTRLRIGKLKSVLRDAAEWHYLPPHS
jgi:hypothetical protein